LKLGLFVLEMTFYMTRDRIIFSLLFAIICSNGIAQENRYVIYFTDKEGSQFTIEEPQAYLSERAILRRQKQQINVTTDDLPVNSWYLDSLTGKGADVFFTSRWFNAALVQATEDEVAAIKNIIIVDSVAYAAPGATLTARTGDIGKLLNEETDLQNEFHNIDSMHSDGYFGGGIWIAVMDGGFRGVNTLSAFQHLYEQNKIVMARNFVNNDEQVYQFTDHGTKVLSLISGFIPGQFTGVAHEAMIGLFITEEMATEYRVEEYNWLFAAEMADSAGFDIINTSLGYFSFNDPAMDYTYADMDGRTTVITKASNFASQRGMLLVTSAGNEGASTWKYISAPADAFDNLAVGAVNLQGTRASFSSIGPTFDGRIKPDISALGSGIKVINAEGNIVSAMGTSFSAPIVSGIAAGVWQRFSHFTMPELRLQLISWGTQADNPDVYTGHGVLIYENDGTEITAVNDKEEIKIEVYPNPAQDKIYIKNLPDRAITSFYSISGRPCPVRRVEDNIFDIQPLPSGIYVLQVKYADGLFNYRLIKE
jgi:serine protease AprX